MSLRSWRIDMQKCLLEVERVENLKVKDPFLYVPQPIVSVILNLARDLERQTHD